MNRTKAIRGYVWIFCVYLATAIEQICHWDAVIRPPHFERSFFFPLFPNVIGPAICVVMAFSALTEFQSHIERAVIILTAMTFAFSAIFALHQFEYISFSLPHSLSSWSWLLATVL